MQKLNSAHKYPSYVVKSQKGQALLFVVVATTIALVVGVNIANRSLSSAKRTTSTDTFTRVLNAAEGGIELAVAATTQQLNRLAGDGPGSIDTPFCRTVYGNGSVAYPDGSPTPTGCTVHYAESKTKADVVVSHDDDYNSTNPFEQSLSNPGTVLEINLEGYGGDNVVLCWGRQGGGSETGAEGTALYHIVYTVPGAGDSVVVRRAFKKQGSFIDDLNPAAFAEIADGTGRGDYDVCGTVTVKGADVGDKAPYGLRLKSTHRPTDIAVYAEAGESLPSQGHRIVSTGRLQNDNSGGTENITKEVIATKTFSFLPAIFDYAIYMHNGSLTKN